ncbi:MAG: glycosyltransferase family 4 protein [Chloroflexi bacterium]|nr:glycosyltransferase family 4 protein [Chloroflexota bacterium]
MNTNKPPYNALQVINSLGVGGAETYVVRLANRLDREKFRVWIACGEPLTVAADLRPDVGVILLEKEAIRLGRPLHWRHILTFYQLVRRLNIDVVHTHLQAASYFARVGGKLAGRPVVYSSTGPPEFAGAPVWLETHIWPLRKVTYNLVDRFLAGGQEAIPWMQQRRMPLSKVRAIPYGVDLEEFSPHPELIQEVRSQIGLPPGAQVLGVISRLSPLKRVDYAIRLLAAVRQHTAHAHLVIAGDGPLRGELEALAEDLGVTEYTHFLGFRNDVPRVAQCYDLYLFPQESGIIGSATLEAMGCGKPVIILSRDNTEAAIEKGTVLEGENGHILVMERLGEAAECLATLLQQPERLASMGRHSRELAETKWDLNRSVRAVEAIYEELVTRKQH